MNISSQELVKYDLKKRLYIGPTSLDHTLAIIMANSCLVKKGSLVLDPFVGTASVLVRPAVYEMPAYMCS